MQNKQNVFSFHLDESLRFKEGQGVRELIGISLEPEITIEELGDEVRLKGTVELAGEYLPTQEESKYDEFPSIETARIMDRVERGEEGVHNFTHSFPVEITVPIERVSNMEDVLVDIESFDYEIPANNQLRLHAHMNINGIEQGVQEETIDEDFDESATVGPVALNITDEEDTKEEQRPITPEREAPVVQLNDNIKEESIDEEDKGEDESDGRWKYNKSQSLSEFFGSEAEKDVVEVSSESTSEWQQSPDHSSTVEGNSPDESPASVGGIKQIFKHLFPNREDTFTQMKMYIAQEDETLASIAEKYQVSLRQLERANDQDEEVLAGQIIYIPKVRSI